MGRRSEHSRSELQELIIKATGDLIDTHGAGGVTARMIAEAIEYTPGMLYSVFKNLDDIFLQVNTSSLEDLHNNCQTASDESENPRDAILAIANAYMKFALTRQHRFSLIFKPTIRSDLSAPPTFVEKSEMLFGLLSQQLARLSPTASNEDVKIGTRALWCGLHGATTSAISGHLMSDIWQANEAVVHSLMNHYLMGWEQQFNA